MSANAPAAGEPAAPGRPKAPMLGPSEILEILRTSVAQIDALTSDALPDELAPSGYKDDWSIAAVLAHLRACNDELGGAILRIVREDQPAWTARSPRSWQAKSGYHDLPFETNVEVFGRGRAELLAVLELLEPEAWERTATVKVPPGKALERSTRFYGDWLAQHERTHLKDLARRQATRRGT